MADFRIPLRLRFESSATTVFSPILYRLVKEANSKPSPQEAIGFHVDITRMDGDVKMRFSWCDPPENDILRIFRGF